MVGWLQLRAPLLSDRSAPAFVELIAKAPKLKSLSINRVLNTWDEAAQVFEAANK